MNTAGKLARWLLLGVVPGIALGLILGGWWLSSGSKQTGAADTQADSEPLYWVAPMDPNYRRDAPGKSPMGMDLVAVYPEEGEGDAPGTVRISPAVVNNLGVRSVPAERRELQAAIQTVGYVHFDEDRLIHVHPRVDGWLEQLFVKAEGDPVSRGQPLYALYSPALVNAQEEMVLALERSSSRLIDAAEARLKALQVPGRVITRLRQNRRVRQTITFYSPQSGVIDNLAVREGFYVQPGTTLMSIGALDEVWVAAEVFERQAALVATGAPVTMTLDYLPGRRWEGVVDYVYPALDRNTRTVKLRLRFPNVDFALKPNMFAQVTIHTHSEEEVLAVPREAVIRTGTMDRVVLDLGEGRFRAVAVTTGRGDEAWVEVLSGVEAGAAVVTSAQFLIDSESSKSADFARMVSEGYEDRPDSVWVEAIIEQVLSERRALVARHLAIDAWQRPAMRMALPVDEAVDLSALLGGMVVQLQLVQGGVETVPSVRVAAVRVPAREDDAEPAGTEVDSHAHH